MQQQNVCKTNRITDIFESIYISAEIRFSGGRVQFFRMTETYNLVKVSYRNGSYNVCTSAVTSDLSHGPIQTSRC